MKAQWDEKTFDGANTYAPFCEAKVVKYLILFASGHTPQPIFCPFGLQLYRNAPVLRLRTHLNLQKTSLDLAVPTGGDTSQENRLDK
jgi:hypothetical protein